MRSIYGMEFTENKKSFKNMKIDGMLNLNGNEDDN